MRWKNDHVTDQAPGSSKAPEPQTLRHASPSPSPHPSRSTLGTATTSPAPTFSRTHFHCLSPDSTMGDVAVESPANVTPLPRPGALDTLSNIESLEGTEADANDEYATLKRLQRHLESLKRELVRAQEEIKRIQSVPLVIGQFMEAIDQNTGIVQSSTGSNYVVRILSTLDREKLKPSSSVALHRHSNALVDILPPEADSSIAMLGESEKPDVTYADVGGLDMQKQEIREAVELPLTHFDLYRQIGIDPPRGVLLYGPPGTGKTMLVKAVANSTTASFIRVNGSEFVQKYLGEGPRMVRDVFRMARENSPAIIFIDEIDAIATKRFDAQTGADREVQRILLELLNQMDGFEQTSNVKVIMATNRADTLDPALLRPGRLDRKIEFPSLRDRRERRLIFTTIASKMSLSPEVDLDSLIVRNEPLSGAVIAAIMQEAGLRAVRKNRYNIIQSDLEDAYQAQVKSGQDDERMDFYR
ncbi:26S protease regulatory subunit 6B [Penicillium lagena]|uniref:26S protease regulatory subunit 6B n=2 Tax=Penicillium TaxID=5073 RepID=UPI002541D54A|nr:26S protease regulatory subunit 6B [Penicillium lagena]KAJ5601610.1 26S protease regulatory subunit 6B [Penicillium lagena]